MFKVDLIEQCKRNNRKAQMQLYNQYCNGMYIVSRRFLNNSAEAEDAVQEAFIKAFKNLNQYKGEVTFGAWLKRIVINTCIDCLKTKKQQLVELEEVHLKVIESIDNEWLVEDGMTIETIKKAINSLKDKYKCVLKLYLIEGYDHQEISKILGITEVNSRTQLSRGRQHLKELLKQKSYVEGY